MRSKGHETISVNDSKKAIETAMGTSPDLILLDLMMPEPTGFQLCRMMRGIPAFAGIPIIIVTALDDSDSRLVAFGAGADSYITKPIDVLDLTDTVKEMLIRAH